MADDTERVDLTMTVEAVVTGPALARLRRAVVYEDSMLGPTRQLLLRVTG